MKYTIMFDYYIPQFTDIDVTANSKQEALKEAEEIFKDTYPEAIDFSYIIKEIDDA